ncbi:MAG: site-specific integrase, partial [Schwartzia sp.]|nr:site-specific integrase [Schwartzia sp. (in: firmicutes)]
MGQSEDFFLRDNQAIEQNEALSDKSKRRLNRSKAENTVKAYDADWRDFLDWCRAHEKTPLPAAPETIVNYVNDLADNARANTVARRVTAISENHIAAGLSAEKNPAHDGMVRAAVAAIRREKGTFQHGKSPILLETLPLLADCFQGDSLPTLRDRALILLGFAGAFRRSELVAVQVEDLTFSPQGLVVFIPRAKGDQTGKGSSVAIPFAPDA